MLSLLYWCYECNLPLLSDKCCSCGSQGKTINAGLRPIMLSEKNILEEQFKLILPWPIFYGSTGWLYYEGKAIGRMSLKSGYPQLKITEKYRKISCFDSILDEKDFKRLIIEANIESLIQKEAEAIDFINEVVANNNGDHPTVAFSGGKDSSVTAALVQRALGHAALFFGDTTIEFPDTYDYLKRISNNINFSLSIEVPPKSFYDIVQEFAPPSQSMRWCCTVVKASPLNIFLQKNDQCLLFFDGIRRHESKTREDYERVSKNPKAVNQILARPILNWTTMDVWTYIWWRNLDYNSLYDKGYGRAGCMHCPYNTRYDNFLTRRFFPKKHDAWVNCLSNYFDSTNAGRNISESQKDFWIDYGWKHRLPHRKRVSAGKIQSWSEKRKDIKLDVPVNFQLLEFLRPIGIILIKNGNWFLLSGNDVKIEGIIGDTRIKVKGILSRQILKAFHKYFNCVGCGGCVGICPSGAISIELGKIKICAEKCNRCGRCLGTKLLGSGCVSLTYKSITQTLQEEIVAEVTKVEKKV